MTVEDLAAFLRRSTKTVYRYAAQRRIPHMRSPGGQLLFDRQAVLNAMRLDADSGAPPPATCQSAAAPVLAAMASDLTTLNA